MSDQGISKIIGRVRRLDAAGTRGPWLGGSLGGDPCVLAERGAWARLPIAWIETAARDRNRIPPRADCELIAAYRQDAPALADEVERLQGLVPVWIPTAERMPDLLEWVLVAFVTGAVTRALRTHGGWDLGNSRLFAMQDVTHWMPLPAAPEAAETVLATAERGERAMEEASFAIRDEPAADSLDRSELAKRLAVQVVLTKQEKQ